MNKILTSLVRILLVLAFVGAAGAPVYAGEPAEIKGEVEKIVKGEDIPEMLRDKGVTKILKVDGVKVLVNKDTEFEGFEGMIEKGDEVEVSGKVKAILADKIDLRDDTETEFEVNGEDVKLTGEIDKIIYRDQLPEKLTSMGVTKILLVDGIKVIVNEDTDFDGDKSMVGDTIRVEGTVHVLCARTVTLRD